MLFGENEFAARLFPALCALGGVFVTAAFGASLYGRRAGFIAGAVTATSLLYFAIGTINITDMPLTFFLTLAFASFYTARTSGRKRWYVVFCLASALAVLTKGLVGVFLPGLVRKKARRCVRNFSISGRGRSCARFFRALTAFQRYAFSGPAGKHQEGFYDG